MADAQIVEYLCDMLLAQRETLAYAERLSAVGDDSDLRAVVCMLRRQFPSKFIEIAQTHMSFLLDITLDQFEQLASSLMAASSSTNIAEEWHQTSTINDSSACSLNSGRNNTIHRLVNLLHRKHSEL